MKKYHILFLFAICLSGLLSCKKSAVNSDTATTTTTITGNKIAPEGFNFITARGVNLNLSLKAPNGEALSGVVVSVYLLGSTDAGSAIYKGITDKNGSLNAQLSVASSVSQVVIDPSYLGLLHYATANITNNAINATLGGATGFSGDIVPQTVISASGSSGLTLLSVNGNPAFSYPSPYVTTADAVLNTSSTPLNYGVPKYLEPTNDVIPASLLSFINASIPEGVAITTNHPEYLSSSATSTLNVTAKSDVWITFVSETAAYLNSLAFYTYPTGTPPKKIADVKNATMIFPNTSILGGGGGLSSGNKVKIGTFDAGTSIGFICLQNAWTGAGVDVNSTMFFSDAALNPETVPSLQKHSVVLYDDLHKLNIIGFEDLNRQTGSDNDFDDVVFYATSNPVAAISNVGVLPIDKGADTDGDGVIDALDAFPKDASKAYVSYFPSQTGFATLAFEDNWPLKGDYDLNDLVLNYRYTFVSNAQNQVVTIQGDYNIAAVGASFKNGFGVQFPFAASAVSSVTGQKFKDNYIRLASNGVEAGQKNAVIIPFDNTDAVINNPDYSYFVNTLTSKAKVTGATTSVLITLVSPMAQSNITIASLNPFLISNEIRSYEIHLPGYAPTALANISLFSTGDDASLPISGKYYLSKDNWPWAISFNGNFTYPVETVPINIAYPHFAAWASSGGASYTDWYSNTASDYRSLSNLFTK